MSSSEFVPVDSTILHVQNVQISNLLSSSRIKKFKQIKDIRHVLLLNRRTCRTVLHGYMQNQAGPKNMCKKTRETCAGQCSMGELFSVSRGVVVCLLFVPWAPISVVFFNLLMGSGWRASLGRFRQISSSWRHYFKELLKLQPGDINVATPSHRKKSCCRF